MSVPTNVYLGDGLYAAEEDGMIKLSTERDNGEHYVMLEPEVFQALLDYAKAIGWLK